MLPYQKDILDFGWAFANPSARNASTDMWHPRHKDYDGMNPSEDTITVATAGNFTGFTFNGTAFVLGTAIAVTSPALIQAAIENEVKKLEKNVYVRVSYTGGNLTVRHIGDLRLSGVNISDVGAGANQSLTNNTTVQAVVDFTLNDVQGQIGPLEFAGSQETLANEPYNWSGTTATDDAKAAQLATDIATALGALSITIVGTLTGVRNDATASFDISGRMYQPSSPIKALGQNKLLLEKNGSIIFV